MFYRIEEISAPSAQFIIKKRCKENGVSLSDSIKNRKIVYKNMPDYSRPMYEFKRIGTVYININREFKYTVLSHSDVTDRHGSKEEWCELQADGKSYVIHKPAHIVVNEIQEIQGCIDLQLTNIDLIRKGLEKTKESV